MPYREMNDGTMIAVRADNRPPRSPGCSGRRCGTAGMGATGPVTRSGQMRTVTPGANVVTPGAYSGPALSAASRAALAVGARTGDRAARYAVAVVRSRGLGDITVIQPGIGVDNTTGMQLPVDASLPVGTNIASSTTFGPSSGSGGSLTFGSDSSASTAAPISSGGFLSSLFGPTPVPTLLTAANQGYQAYNAFGKPVAAPVQAAAPISTGLVLGVLGVVAVLGIGIAVAMGSGRRAAPRMANRGRRGHRAPKYFIQKRAA